MSVLRAEEQADYGSCRNRRTLGEMLHFILSILLGILKIIGILLLTVLVLLLLVLSAILFGPVRYRIRAAKTEEALEAAVTVSWLHLIRARLLVDGRKQTHALDIRIFGISLTKLKEWLDRRKQKKKQKRSSSQSEKSRTAQAGKRQGLDESGISEDTKERNSRKAESSDEQTESGKSDQLNVYQQEQQAEKESDRNSQEEDSVQQDDTEEVKSRSRKNIAARIFEILRTLPYKIRTFCATIKSNVERIRELGKHMKRIGEGIWSRLQQAAGIPEKIQQLLDFVEDYHLKELFAEGKAELNGLWRHYRPRKATGYLQFGTGDPALTGELTGILYLLLPAVSEVQIQPDFNDAMLQMELELYGRIRVCHLAATAWRLFRNKKLRRLIAKIRKKGD